jgi:hypothetical protein
MGRPSRAPSITGALWYGQPDAGAYLRREFWPAAGIGLLAAALGVAWEAVSLIGDYSVVWPVSGVLFLTVAVYGLAVRPVLVWRAAHRLAYSIDERHVGLTRGRSRRLVWQIATADLPPFAVVPGGRRQSCADLVFFGVPPVDSPWGWWRIVDVRSRFGCLAPADADAAAAALERLWSMPGVVRPRAWARGLTTPQGTRYPAYDPLGGVTRPAGGSASSSDRA